jgi:hypothetical protein
MDLTRCRRCGDDTVVPVRWEQDGRAQWWIRLRCRSCGCFRETIASDEQVLVLDTLIHRRAQPIVDAITELDRARTSRQPRSIATPLDLFDARDFAGPPPSRDRLKP